MMTAKASYANILVARFGGCGVSFARGSATGATAAAAGCWGGTTGGLSLVAVRLEGSWAGDEFLVAVREAVAAERESREFLLSRQILTRRRWPEA